MDYNKQQLYRRIAETLTRLTGGRGNILGVAHCATRLRIVLQEDELADLKGIGELELVKGVFIAGSQIQIIFGMGLVNEIYQAFTEYNNMKDMKVSDLEQVVRRKMNLLHRTAKTLSDVFVAIMPAVLAAALLDGLSRLMGGLEILSANETCYGIWQLMDLASDGIFEFLPFLIVCSACRRFGGRPVMGMIMGCVMFSSRLTAAYGAAQGAEAAALHILGLTAELAGFQCEVMAALLMGVAAAKLDLFFEKRTPQSVRLLLSPLLTTLTGVILLFTVIGPLGRGISDCITGSLFWIFTNLGIFGYSLFAGVQQLIVAADLHHIMGVFEVQLLTDTGRNVLNPLMSVAIMAQGGSVLGYLALHWKDRQARELCIPGFISILFGITEPALFGVNLRHRFPFVAGCIGGAAGGAVVYLTELAALGFGVTVLPGLALADPSGNGYWNYICAHGAALAVGFAVTLILGSFIKKDSYA